MAETITITAEPRDRAGKGAARSARRAGKVPGVVYGDKKPPELINLDELSLNNWLRDPAFQVHLHVLELDGARQRVLARAIQRDPVTDWPIHIDFLRVGETTTIHVEVPVHFLNEERSPGIRRGGVLNAVRREVELVCRADAIPDALEVDLAGLDIGDSVRISAIKLPEGAHPAVTGRDFVIATIAAPSAVRAEAAEAAAAAAQGEAAPAEAKTA